MFSLECSGRSWSPQQNQQKIEAVRQYLEQHGFKQGHVLALSGALTPVYLWTLCAAWSLGGVVLPLNPNLSARELKDILKESRADYLTQDYFSSFSGVQSIAWCPMDHGMIHAASFVFPEHDQAVSLIRTSGSTGQPKLALHNWGNHYFSAIGSAENIAFDSSHRYLLSLPLYHVGGLAIVIKSVLSQGVLCLPNKDQTLGDAIVFHQPSHLSLVATQLHRLLKIEALKPSLSACSAILLGGSAIPSSLIQQAYTSGLPIFVSYGSTEMSSQITTTRPQAALEELYTSGYVLPHRDLQISPSGEIQVKGKTLFMGYYSQSGLESAVNADGWFETRDRGVMTSSKLLQVFGRMDHMFISGGENIQPEEIESILLSYPGVLQAVVLPVSSQEYGFRPFAFVDASQIHEDRLKAYLREFLPGYKVPDYFLPLPGSLTEIKPSRKRLKELAQQFMVEHKSA